MKNNEKINDFVTFTPASRKSLEIVRQLMMDDCWLVLIARYCNSVYLERYHGGDFEDYCPREDEVHGLYYSREAAEAAKEKVIDTWRCWLLIEDGPAGVVYTTEYTGGYYSEYTNPHESVVGEYPTKAEADKALKDSRDAMHCWLLITDDVVGSIRLAEYTGGTYQQYAGNGDVVGTFKEEAEARAEYERLYGLYYEQAI